MAGKQMTVPDAWARFGDVGRFGLGAAALLLPLKRRDWNGSFDALTGVLASAAISKTLKPFIDERRPNGEDEKSFPSQHAAESFAAGLSLRRTLGEPFGPIGVGAATLVATSRLFARKHWLRDILAGIAIGTAATIAVDAWRNRSA